MLKENGNEEGKGKNRNKASKDSKHNKSNEWVKVNKVLNLSIQFYGDILRVMDLEIQNEM